MAFLCKLTDQPHAVIQFITLLKRGITQIFNFELLYEN